MQSAAPSAMANGSAVSAQPVPTESAYTKKDVKWTFKETLVGKTAEVLLVDTVASVILLLVFLILIALRNNMSTDQVVDAARTAVLFGAEYATSGVHTALTIVSVALFFLIVFLLVFLVPSVFLVKAVCNFKARKVVPTREAVLAHHEETRFKWRLSYGLALGIIDAFAIWALFYIVVSMITGDRIASSMNVVMAVVAIGIAEIRIKRLNHMFHSFENSNEQLINMLLSGRAPAGIPEKYLDLLGVAKIVRILDIGAAHSVKGAVRVIKIVDLRAKMLSISSFIGSWVSAIVNTCTLGMLVIMVVNLNDVTAQIARGQGIQRIGSETRTQSRPMPIFEIVCAIVFMVMLYFVILGLQQPA